LQSEAPNSSLRYWRKPSVKVRHVTKVVVVIGCVGYKAGTCDAAWCAPCTWAPLWWLCLLGALYKCSTFTFFYEMPRYTLFRLTDRR